MERFAYEGQRYTDEYQLIVREVRFTKGKYSAQHSVQRAPDGWESPRFLAGFWLQVGSGKAALSSPAHPRVTSTVGAPYLRQGLVDLGFGGLLQKRQSL